MSNNSTFTEAKLEQAIIELLAQQGDQLVRELGRFHPSGAEAMVGDMG